MTQNADVKQGEGNAEAVKSNSDGSEQPLHSSKTKLPEPPGAYTQPVANVGFKLGHTINLGNYESLRVDVDVHIPCYTNEIDEVFDYAKGWVEEKFEEVMKEINENVQGAG